MKYFVQFSLGMLFILGCNSSSKLGTSNTIPSPVNPPLVAPENPSPNDFNRGQFSGPGGSFSASPKYSQYNTVSHIDGRTLSGNRYQMLSPQLSFGQREMQATINALEQLSQGNGL